MAYASKLSACLYTSMKHYLITSFVRTDIILNAAITNDFFPARVITIRRCAHI